MTDAQNKWVEEMANTGFTEWMEQFKRLKKAGKWQAIHEVCKARLAKKGIIDLGHGSIWRWVDKHWFSETVKLGVIFPVAKTIQWQEKRTKTVKETRLDDDGFEVEYDKEVSYFETIQKEVTAWCPSFSEVEETLSNGQKKMSRDYSKFQDYENKYLAWKESQREVKNIAEKEVQEILQF